MTRITVDWARKVLAEMDSQLQSNKRQSERRREQLRDNLRRLAGDDVDAMFASERAAKEMLCDSRPQWRIAAMLVLSNVWGLAPETADLLTGMLDHETDHEALKIILSILSRFYTETKHAFLSRRFSEIAADERLPQNVRASASLAELKLERKVPASEAFALLGMMDLAKQSQEYEEMMRKYEVK